MPAILEYACFYAIDRAVSRIKFRYGSGRHK